MACALSRGRSEHGLQGRRRYGGAHKAPEMQKEAVYGLTELNREALASARLVANPGCYPTSVQLPLVPLLQQELILKVQLHAHPPPPPPHPPPNTQTRRLLLQGRCQNFSAVQRALEERSLLVKEDGGPST